MSRADICNVEPVTAAELAARIRGVDVIDDLEADAIGDRWTLVEGGPS